MQNYHKSAGCNEQLEQAADRETLKKQLIQDYEAAFSNPYYAASKMLVDMVILPRETRPQLVRLLQILRNKKITHPKCKHGNIPL
ncbi:carboxyl transferase domain-containing protein [Thermodesulfobacteriota bacterium]